MSPVTRLPLSQVYATQQGIFNLCCYAVTDVDNTPLFRKGLSNSLLTQQRCSIAANFRCRSNHGSFLSNPSSVLRRSSFQRRRSLLTPNGPRIRATGGFFLLVV